MVRVRSPNYPAITLSDAIARVKTIHDAEHHLAAPREVIAKHLGYNGLNGAALTAISAIGKYGLLEDANGDKLRVSKLAMSILYPSSPDERTASIKEAASKPALFVEIANEWEGARPSDENLRSYLIRRNFAVDAIDRVIKSYRETMDLVTSDSEGYNAPAEPNVKRQEPLMQPQTHHLSAKSLTTAPPVLGSPRIGTTSVKIEDDRIEVSAVLLFQENIEELIRKLQAVKTLRPRAADEEKKDEAAN